MCCLGGGYRSCHSAHIKINGIEIGDGVNIAHVVLTVEQPDMTSEEGLVN